MHLPVAKGDSFCICSVPRLLFVVLGFFCTVTPHATKPTALEAQHSYMPTIAHRKPHIMQSMRRMDLMRTTRPSRSTILSCRWLPRHIVIELSSLHLATNTPPPN
ncbi:hypothetical protein P171DRAFT_85496 [Karstenula rhodostoma CBS 690.94]|uniref:Uncharacterized protein n=1 Tax=Karstenula rhodostoma CBS 690.94 TaxID=1392251 RepID=A0A9P4P9K6_9PLEO|nr:hypothetical protein P171DRAFT_85496 [Karstenula rhodostoma CBS 690.94]